VGAFSNAPNLHWDTVAFAELDRKTVIAGGVAYHRVGEGACPPRRLGIRWRVPSDNEQHSRVDFSDPELDPRLAAQYDGDRPWTEDFDFFLRLVSERSDARVVDLGCGTGTLTTAIARTGLAVTGVDPNPSFLAIARAKPGAELVSWIRGTASDLPSARFDTALMTSNVAQVFLSGDEWTATLAELHRALMPGGRLAFDTRDPAAKAWETWSGGGRTELPDGSVVDNSITVTFQDEVATADHVFAFSDGTRSTAEVLATPLPGTTWAQAKWGYRFRSEELIRRTLEDTGFEIDHVYGGWNEEPPGEGVGEFVVICHR
jgi:SAM-dependent methyltransferase